MSTYTPSLGLELITPGSQAGLWGNTTNNSLNLIDQAITGVTPISFASASGSTYTLTDYNGAQDESRAAVLNITGTASGANTVVIPNKQKTYLVRNNTGKDVLFQTAVASATYTVGAGYSILIFCDGNNNVFTGIAAPSVGTLLVNAGGTGVATFGAGGFVKSSGGTNALSAVSSVSLSSEVSGTLPVTNGGTGKASLASGALLFGNGTSPVGEFIGSASGQVATWTGSGWAALAPTSGVSSVSVTAPITNLGSSTAPNIGLAASGAVAGSYTNSNVTIDIYGRVTAISTGSSGGTGTVTSVGLSVPTGFTVSNTPVTTSGTIALSMAGGYAIPTTTSQTNWDAAYSQRLQWDGGSTNLNAANGRSNLGLGSMATQNTTSYVPISGGTFSGDVLSSTLFRAPAISCGSSSSASMNMGVSGTGSALNFYAPAVGNGFTSIFFNATSSAVSNQSYAMAFNNFSGTTYAPYQFNGAGNATATNGSWIDGSDVRIKENIVPIDIGLDAVAAMNPVKYSFKQDKKDKADRIGLIAQELEAIVPDVVFTSDDPINGVEGMKSVAYTNLIPVLIKAIQELKAEVDSLKTAK